jgi:hypothetical protein
VVTGHKGREGKEKVDGTMIEKETALQPHIAQRWVDVTKELFDHWAVKRAKTLNRVTCR